MSKSVSNGVRWAVILATGCAALGACGRVGALEQPAPLYGQRAKEDYRATQAADAAAARRAEAARGNAAADQPDPTDNAPATKRDLEAPEQKLTPLSQQPLSGTIQDPRGAPPSITAPNR